MTHMTTQAPTPPKRQEITADENIRSVLSVMFLCLLPLQLFNGSDWKVSATSCLSE